MRKNAKLPKLIGKRIKKRRNELRLTQEELADKLGISRVYMGYLEQGRNAPSLALLQKLSRSLNVPLQRFF